MTATTDPRPGILRKAVDVLNTRGRHTGDYWDFTLDPVTAKVCTLGAIAVAAGCDLASMSLGEEQTVSEGQAMDAARALGEHLGIVDGIEDPHIVIGALGGWNDDPARADDEVTAALLDTAYALARAAAIAAREAAHAAYDAQDTHMKTCRACRPYPSRNCREGWELQSRVYATTCDALAACEAYATTGDKVTYHGSKTELHGVWTVHGPSAGTLGAGYTLTRDGDDRVLKGVRIESITPVGGES